MRGVDRKKENLPEFDAGRKGVRIEKRMEEYKKKGSKR